MPKRTDIKRILVIGSGPIVIGQACEFDYSGTQACRVLKSEGYEVVLINSNPATIMTDPIMADRTYIEPITPEVVAEVIRKERPDALLPTLGGQTALNCAVDVADMGVPEKYGVEYIGASVHSIKKAEDRELFKQAMTSIGLTLPESRQVNNMKDAMAAAEIIGFPLIIRPCFTLGGTGGGVAYNIEEYEAQVEKGMDASPYHEVLVEQSVLGWKEYELEVMRDRKDNVVIICSIENLDPMGVHTGDSITVAPAQTLSDKEYQLLRDYSIACIREIGVDTGGSNIQFAVNPENGDVVIIEMNPRVSRSSALASKATGFPIAKIAAKLAIGYTLDEIPNDITRMTPACFEPTIDYCVTKIPRFTFEKFPGSSPTLTTAMKSVGETMAIGRTFKESLQKGLRSLETGLTGLNSPDHILTDDELLDKLRVPNPDRLLFLKQAMLRGMSVDQLFGLTCIDPWFLHNIKEIVDFETGIKPRAARCRTDQARADLIREAKRMGFSDKQLCGCFKMDEYKFRKLRKKLGVEPVFKLVDTCGAEFVAYTPYYYSSYELESEGRA
jgi:carbamoyl-phosphate synthase large subunit